MHTLKRICCILSALVLAMMLLPPAPTCAAVKTASIQGEETATIALPAAPRSTEAVKARALEAYGQLPLSFIPNQGQVDRRVGYYVQSGGQSLWFTADGVTMGLPETTLRLEFLGANPSTRLEGGDKLPGIVNYFIGNDPAKWRTNIPTYGRVTYRDLWPGVDLTYEGRPGALKSTFTIAPGADPTQIRLAYPAADSLVVDGQGNLIITVGGGEEVRESAPLAWQEIRGRHVPVAVTYQVAGQSYSFALPEGYDPAYPLVIDPELLYSTFLGGSSSDYGTAIAVDGAGSAYVTGYTYSPDFPTTAGAFDTSYNGPQDAFVVKLNAGGTGLAYATFLGGSSQDMGYAIAVDGAGSAYVTGYTGSSDFPTTAGAFDTSYNNADAFVVKLNAGGTGLAYATFLGGGNNERGEAIAVDGAGSAYVTGWTYSYDFPTTAGAFDTSYNYYDAFVVKLNAGGTGLAYATFLGGSSSDEGHAIAVDGAGNAYVTGNTGPDFPTTAGAFDTSYNGYRDAFVVRLNAGGTGLAYATFLGGSDEDWGHAIAVDGAGSAYVTGNTASSDFPTTAGAFDTSANGSWDAFVVKLNAGGTGLAYATFLGGSYDDYSYAIAVDGAGSAYVTGNTYSDFPTTAGAFDTSFNGSRDAFVAKLATGNITSVVLVQDESGNPLSGAQVHRNGNLAGTTSVTGTLTITGLQVGDQLVARQRVTEVTTAKGSHNQDSSQDWAYRVYITSLDIPATGEPTPFIVSNPALTQTLTLKKDNALIGFNIVASVEWDANTSYLDELRQGFEKASAYLYDASDGQMLFERVTIYDNGQHWADADYQVRASNQERPRAGVDCILLDHPNQYGHSQHVFFGRYFDGRSANQGAWTQPNGFRAQIHEFGHYGLGLWDSYYYYDQNQVKHDSDCTSAAIRTNNTDSINATLMDYQYNATEFAMRGVAGLWSTQCQQTHQWQVHGKSDWETFVPTYSDTSNPVRWTLKTPGTHGSVVAGPMTIPLDGWSTATIGNNANTGICASPPIVQAKNVFGLGVPLVKMTLKKNNGPPIYQGQSGWDGRLVILGAADGDTVQLRGLLNSGQSTISCVSGQSALGQGIGATELVVTLEPDPFNISVSVLPGGAPGTVQVNIRSSVSLDHSPTVNLYQSGAASPIAVTMSYDSGAGMYTGTATLDASLPLSGNIEVSATDTQGHTVETFSAFNIIAVIRNQDTTVWSSDGQVELYIPANALSADSRVSIMPDGIPGAPPDELVQISGPYTIKAETGVSLSDSASLSFYYLDTGGTLSHANLSTAQIYRWDGGQWIALVSIVSENNNYVSAPISAFGTYALMAEQPSSVYLPIILKNR